MIWTIVTIALFLAHVFAISVLILVERRQPAATLAWLLTLVFLPIVGLVVYFLIGAPRFARTKRKMALAARRIDAVRKRQEVERKLAASGGEGEAVEPRTESLLRLGAALSSTPPSAGNVARLLENAAATYRAMSRAIEAARHHVHVQFYIIRPDEAGQRLRDRLVAAARRGVQVRVLVDAVGSAQLPREFWKELIAAGGKAAAFRPVLRAFTRFRRRDRIDFRNHRKIVVVDGTVGFTGGINIGREYLGLDPEIKEWRDSHVELDGPAVLALQCAFAEDWFTTTGEEVDDDDHYPEPRCHEHGAVVQVVDSGPDRDWSSIEAMYAFVIGAARKRVWITNPYFVPSSTIENALVSAALRGVDVRILVPRRSDHLVVQLASRSYFPPLLEAGARIYRYARGFVHAKTMVVDDWVGTVGSANMDMRSFRLNFELNPFVIDRGFATTLARSFEDDLRGATEYTADDVARQTVIARLLTGAARLMSPLL
ncbi:MAG: cardiolipin synthase [Planctomycetes bacterium]|nr:cardiolipin synthase [Planctomycetota bacterium]